MQISSNHTRHNPSFQKQYYTKKADDIVRHARNNFPMTSPSYAVDFWMIFENLKTKQNYEKLIKVFKKLGETVKIMRSNGQLSPNNPIFDEIIEKAKDLKTGNCAEYCNLTLATLFANGYTSANFCMPAIEVKILDKNNKEIFTHYQTCDHLVVNAKIKNPNNNTKKDVIMDAWLGKAMSVEEAKEEYKRLFYEKGKQQAKIEAKQKFLRGFPSVPQFLSFMDECKFKTRFYLVSIKDLEFPNNDAVCWGKALAEKYPKLIMENY